MVGAKFLEQPGLDMPKVGNAEVEPRAGGGEVDKAEEEGESEEEIETGAEEEESEEELETGAEEARC